MSVNFSRDNADPPTRFRAGPGQTGQAAAMQAIRPKASPGPKPGQGRSQERRKGGGESSAGRLGLPDLEPQQGSNRHLLPALHHANIQDLGRDLPFGLWAVHNGYLPEIAGKGVEPFDWLEHGG